MLLAIDTSTRYAGVCLRDDQRVVASRSWHSPRNHTRELLPAIQQVLEQAGVSLDSLKAIAVSLGPGGFSALRVGMSVAKGMAFSLGLPMVGVRTLELEAYPYAPIGLPTCPMLDVGRGEVAAALFLPAEEGWRKVIEEAIWEPEGLVESLSNEGYRQVVFCGEGVQGKEAFGREALGGAALVVLPYNPASRLWALAEIGWTRYYGGQLADVANLQPFYLRRPSIGAPPRYRSVRS